MKKLLIFFVFLFSMSTAIGQGKFPVTGWGGSLNTESYDSGARGAYIGFHFRHNYADTTELNTVPYIKSIPGFIALANDTLRKRNKTATKWDIVGGGGGSTGGTVTDVAALTIGTSGTDISSTVANGTTSPVITLNVPTASNTNRGALGSAKYIVFDSGFVRVTVLNDSTLRFFSGNGNFVDITVKGTGGGTKDTVQTNSPLYVITGGTKDTLAILFASRTQSGALSDTGYKHFDSSYLSVTASTDSTLTFTRGDGNTTTVAIKGVGKTYTGNAPISVTGTVVAADTATANTGLATLYQNSLKQDNLRNPISFLTPAIVRGDSHALSVGTTVADAPVNLAAAILGFPIVNQAVGGTTCMYALQTTYNAHQQINIDSASFIETMWNGIGAGANVNTPRQAANVYRALITNQFLNYAKPASDASLSKIGAWSTYNTYTNAYGKAPFLSGLGETTSTVGDSIVWVSPSSTTLSITGIGDYTTGLGKYTIFIDGVLKDTIDCANQTTNLSSAFDPFAVSKIQVTKNYYNLSSSTHTVVVKNISGTIIIDYVGTLKTDYTTEAPIYILSTVRTQAISYGNTATLGGNALVEECNSAAKKVIGEFQAANQNSRCYYIDINKDIDYNYDFLADGTHWKVSGNKKAANNIVNFITTPLSQYNAIDQAYTNYIAVNDNAVVSGITLPVPTGVGQKNIGTISLDNGHTLLYSYNGNMGLGDGAFNYNSTGINSIAIGLGAQGTGLQTAGYNNSMGVQSGLSITGGTHNNLMGFQTGLNITNGNENNVLGYRALVSNSGGSDNIALGTQSNFTNVSGNNNFSAGTNSLVFNEGSNNVALGHNAGFNATAMSGSVLLGYQAGYNNTASNKLFIANSNTANPLIGGDFSTGQVSFSSSGYGTTGQFLQAATGAAPSWTSTVAATSVPLSGITAATTSATIDNLNNEIYWQWSTLGNNNAALRLESNSTTAAGNNQNLFSALLSGVNATSSQATVVANINNTHSGTGSVNYGLRVFASNGATNYPFVVPSTGGFNGFGTNTPTEMLEIVGNVKLSTAGNKLKIATGSNASVGTATLSSGTVTVSTTAVATGSLIFVTYDTPSGTLASGLSAPVASITNGTSFVINSLTTAGVVNTLDNSTVRWWIIN